MHLIMNREQYLAALVFCLKVETAGAIAGEVAMLLREDPVEKQKLDIYRRLEASNKILCMKALEREGVARPKVETSFYRNGIKLGQRWGKGDWSSFLDRMEATVHPNAFAAYLVDDNGQEIEHEYEGVDSLLLRHLVRHEQSQMEFLERERQGMCESTSAMEAVLNSELCAGLIGPQDPVGW
ncbi:hypothetical protein [Bythopirellula polymerisocia]|uniref:Uncharacterized protein n=1 Tax=Bythopirellula polymerisocia TaxID=2528003 RepID=A0A5C6CAN1_9BACT|nr:hypothetical protein [Bythopirellula polymerisocia]TWU21773.1 hypothetical protein Pla144_44690 [Bythopirellula polymerisocia]